MRRRAIIGALLLIGVGIVLGTTLFRADIAQATGLAQSVVVGNTAANPVPVREQNLGGSGNIKVHEQGTANVNVTNSSLTVASPAPITGGSVNFPNGCPTGNTLGRTVTATALTILCVPETRFDWKV
jgi:hypothetical protein